MSVTPLHLPQTLTEYLISEHNTLGKSGLIYTQGEKTKESNFLKRGLVILYHSLLLNNTRELLTFCRFTRVRIKTHTNIAN